MSVCRWLAFDSGGHYLYTGISNTPTVHRHDTDHDPVRYRALAAGWLPDDTLVQAENTLIQAENTFVPAENTLIQAENMLIQAENTLIQAATIFILTEKHANTR